MRYIYFAFAVMLILSGCTKKDLLFFKKVVRDNQCQIVSVNQDKQSTNDFFLIKKIDKWGRVIHIKTQLKDIYANVYLYDYDITYEKNKAIFKGYTAEMNWFLDVENNTNPNFFDPPAYFRGKSIIDNKSFEVLFDQKTKFATQVKYTGSHVPLVTIKYDKRNFVDSINEFDVTTDRHGNYLTIFRPGSESDVAMFGYRGITYWYNEQDQRRKKVFYEPTSIYIHDKYSLLELFDWGPFQPDRERTDCELMWEYPPEEIEMDVIIYSKFYDHIYDQRGNLTAYTFEGEFSRSPGPEPPYAGIRPRNVRWRCADTKTP